MGYYRAILSCLYRNSCWDGISQSHSESCISFSLSLSLSEYHSALEWIIFVKIGKWDGKWGTAMGQLLYERLYHIFRQPKKMKKTQNTLEVEYNFVDVFSSSRQDFLDPFFLVRTATSQYGRTVRRYTCVVCVCVRCACETAFLTSEGTRLARLAVLARAPI